MGTTIDFIVAGLILLFVLAMLVPKPEGRAKK
jgi:hypothetical protein